MKLLLPFCDELLGELKKTIANDRIKKLPHFNQRRASEVIAWLTYKGAKFIISSASSDVVIRDRNDEFYLRLAEVSDADFLLSYDQDLLVLKKHKNTQILRPEEWLKISK